MFNSKVIVVASIVGFLLSFLTGIFSGVGFGFVILRAIIFSAILGAIAAGIMIVFERFLDMDGSQVNSYPTENVGSMVDITIGDEDLVEEDSAPGFYVDENLTNQGANSQSNEGDVKQSSVYNTEVLSEQNKSDSDGGSGKVDNISNENPNKSVVNEQYSQSTSSGFVKSDIQTITSSTNYETESEENLDALPDFGSDVKEKGESFFDKRESPLIDKGVQDAEVMAQAIRTILNKDG